MHNTSNGAEHIAPDICLILSIYSVLLLSYYYYNTYVLFIYMIIYNTYILYVFIDLLYLCIIHYISDLLSFLYVIYNNM